MSLRNIYYTLSPGFRLFARRVYYYPYDLMRCITGKRHRYEPPKGKTFIGSGDFIKQGQLHLQLLKEHGSLISDHYVLDIGSGMGRTAVALTTYISSEGSYDGFDIMKQGVIWCNKKIGKDYSNFRFKHVSIGNDLYNTNKTSGEKFKFPYDDNCFDVSFLFSVFSHMLPAEVENYLLEIHRTLKPGGKCLATFFIYEHADDFQLKHPEDRFKFPVDMGNYRLMNEKVKSANVAYQKDFLNRMFTKAKLSIEKEVEGFWKGEQTGHNDFQDIIVLKKEE